MSDPQNPEVTGYVSPTEAQLAARSRRNLAIAGGLAAFVIIVFLMMLYRLEVYGL